MDEVFLSRDAPVFLARNSKGLKASGMRVMMKLISQIELGNRVVVNLADIERDLEMSSRVVRAAVDKLLELGIIAKRAEAYQFNPALAWKGDLEDQPEALEYWNRRELIKLVPELPAAAHKPKSKATKKKLGEEK